MNTVNTVWQAVQRRYDFEIPKTWQHFCENRGWVNDVINETGLDKEEAFSTLCETVKALHTAGVTEVQQKGRWPHKEDPRWSLLVDLHQALTPRAKPWSPLTIDVPKTRSQRRPALGDRRLRMEFDNALSLRELQQATRRAWRKLRTRQLLREKRRMKPEATALIRFVCLDTPRTQSWDECVTAWNQKFPHWQYADARALQTAFHREETRLTGTPHSLARLYTPTRRRA